MLKLQLRRHDAPSYRTVAIEFPAPEPDLQENMKELGIGITTEKLCLVDAVQNDHRGLQALAGTLVNADEVQYLAKRMDSFDKNELNTFYAAAEHEKLTEVKDLINLTFNLHCYALVSDFSDLSAIGQRYELCRRMAIPADEIRTRTLQLLAEGSLAAVKALLPLTALYIPPATHRNRYITVNSFPNTIGGPMMRRPLPWNPAIITAASTMNISICPAGRWR